MQKSAGARKRSGFCLRGRKYLARMERRPPARRSLTFSALRCEGRFFYRICINSAEASCFGAVLDRPQDHSFSKMAAVLAGASMTGGCTSTAANQNASIHISASTAQITQRSMRAGRRLGRAAAAASA